MAGSPDKPLAPNLSEGPREALVIATTSYQDPELRQLRAPAQDAQDLAEILGDPAIGAFNVTLVTDQDERQVRREIDVFLAGRGTSDLVVVYLSCHGMLDRRGRLYFAAADTIKTQLGSTAIPSAWLLEQMDECRARRQVLVLDCCFSGAFAHGSKGDADLALERRLVGQGRGRAVLTASRAGEYSFEGQALSQRPVAGSVFTAGLVEGLRTGAADVGGDGYISLDEAYDYAFTFVQSSGASQTPQRWLYGGEGAIVLARSPAGVAISPGPLPQALMAGLDSPYPAVRIGAIHALGEWLASADLDGTLAAELKLREIAEADIPAVAAAARTCLVKSEPADTADDRGQQVHVAEPSAPEPAPDPAAAPPPLATLSATLSHEGWWYTIPSVSSVVFSPDGRLLATASKDDTEVWLWDIGSGEQLRAFTGHTGEVTSVAFSPDGRLIASAGAGDAVRLWDPATGDQVRALTGQVGLVGSVAFSPGGRLLATAGDAVRVWDPATGERVRTLAEHTLWCSSVAFSPGGRLLATAGDPVCLWDPATGERVRALTGQVGLVGSVAFSPDGRMLATAGDAVCLWDPATGELVRALDDQTAWGNSVAFSADGRMLASAGDAVCLWDAATGERVRTLESHTGWVNAVTFSPDGHLLASGGNDATARLWRCGNFRPEIGGGA